MASEFFCEMPMENIYFTKLVYLCQRIEEGLILLIRKAYNFIYENFLFLFNLGILNIIFNKKGIITNSSTVPILNIRNILHAADQLKEIQDFLKIRKFAVLGFFDEHGNIKTSYHLQLNNIASVDKQKSRDKCGVELVVLTNGDIALKK